MKNKSTIRRHNKNRNMGKAGSLMFMQRHGINVPPFTVTDNAYKIDVSFSDASLFAVRSSADMEDSAKHSYAGQYESILNVEREELSHAVACVLASRYKKNIAEYKKASFFHFNRRPGKEADMQVIIQEMVEADFSGVIFTANPLGILSEIVIVAAYGQGDAVVEDRADISTYHYNKYSHAGYYTAKGNAPILSDSILKKILKTAEKIERLFRKPMDIEYAIKSETLYILQARPVTTLDFTKRKVVLDNSNISESYSGITLPLTQSFAKEVYTGIFTSLLKRLTGSPRLIKKYAPVLDEMVDSYNGHMYYSIGSWYSILAMLPFSEKIIKIWQEMLGVKQADVYFNAPSVSPLIKLRVAASFVRLFFGVQKSMARLNSGFEAKIKKYNAALKRTSSPAGLWILYKKIENDILKDWDWTLINDMYAFLFTALSKGSLSDVPELESMKPAAAMKKLCRTASRYGMTSMQYKRDAKAFIELYGDRCVDELKLETKTYRTSPGLLDKYVASYISILPTSGGSGAAHIGRSFPKVSGSARTKNPLHTKHLRQTLGVYRRLSGIFSYEAGRGIAGRERSRMNRSRLFGIMRAIIIKISVHKSISLYDDIFYLKLDELSKLIRHGRDYHELIHLRKSQYKDFSSLPVFERVVFLGNPFDNADILPNSVNTLQQSSVDVLKGTPVSSGKVRAAVILIDDAKKVPVSEVKNKIIVTYSTDPGWVMHVAACAGIISERGSLLSHTAIISRELKKPAVVNVPGAFSILKNGMEVELDALTGRILVKR